MYGIDVMSNLFPIVGEYNRILTDENPQLITNKPRKMYLLRNFSKDSNLYIGTDENVSEITGFPILPGEVLYLNTADNLYVMSKKIGNPGDTSNTEVELRYMIFS
jgi:hypothetical protein